MKPNIIKIIECFSLSKIGLMTAIQHSEDGIKPNTRLFDIESGEFWVVLKRVLFDDLLINKSEVFFDCETELERVRHSYKTEKDRLKGTDKEMNRRIAGVYWYLLSPEEKNQRTKPEIGSFLKIEIV